ncbi:MAG TPA: ABC transporter ATP-binding protein [Gaiellaceae bacterium]|jgi:lipopolysaccharide transport system ATP-binding protein
MTTAAIEISGLGKRYAIGVRRRGYDTLREAIVENARRQVQRATRRLPQRVDSTLWALKDVSLTIAQGEAVGLIGHNGAGKTTLLKILSRITEPTCGHADVTGRVGSLLEVGTGFHPELTGRENIYLYGSILGMSRPEIRRRFDEIVSFAEVERFLDTPVKRYSSGMSVRLAFAVAAHLEPEILLVDEVLAVGDAAFQRKSLGKMNEVAGEGKTVLFVSHNLAIIQALCRRAVLLSRGEVVADGPVADAIDQYLRAFESSAASNLLDRTDRDGRGWQLARISAVEIRDESGTHPDVVVGGRPATITVHVTEVLPETQCRLTIVNSLGQPITTLDTELPSRHDIRDAELGPRIECELSALPLLPGRYRIDILLKGRNQIQDGLLAAGFFDVEPGVLGERPMPVSGSDGDVVIDHAWRLPA